MFLDFSFLKKRNILIYDGVSLTILKHIIFKEKFNVYFNRWEKLNFWVLVLTLLKFNYRNISEIKKHYKKNFISLCAPKVIITFIDNNPSFYELKSIYPEAITISIQNGVRKSNDLRMFNKKKKYYCDYFLIFSKYHEKFFSKVIKSKYINSGSIKMNEYKKRSFKKKGEVLFISQTATHASELEKVEKFLIKNLIKICTDLKIKFNILCKKNVKKKIVDEFSEIKLSNIFESDASFLPYEIIQKFELKVFVDSTLGLESLAIGEKALAIPLGCMSKHKKKFDIKKKIEKFGFPLKLADKGYCWSNDFEYPALKKKIFKLIKLKQGDWKKIHKKNLLMNYDEGNKKLKKILKDNRIYI